MLATVTGTFRLGVGPGTDGNWGYSTCRILGAGGSPLCVCNYSQSLLGYAGQGLVQSHFGSLELF